MLVRLTPTQIGVHQSSIRRTLEASLPPFSYGDPMHLNNVFESLILGTMDCWICTEEKDNELDVCGFVVTTLSEDSCSKVRNLLIYSIYSTRTLDDAVWVDGLETLAAFARGLGCHRIIAYTDSRSILEHAQKLGFSCNYAFITKEVV